PHHPISTLFPYTTLFRSETLEAMLTKSANNQQEVTDQLGYQVRRAVEMLVQSLDRIDKDRNRKLLRNVSEADLYEAALTVMMRLDRKSTRLNSSHRTISY